MQIPNKSFCLQAFLWEMLMFFQFLLHSIGVLLKLACLVNPRLKSQLARNTVVAIGPRDSRALDVKLVS